MMTYVDRREEEREEEGWGGG